MSILLIRIGLWSVALVLLSFASLRDVRVRLIPNELVLSVTAIGLLAGAVDRPGTLWISFLFAFLLLIVLGTLGHYDVLGMGDAKMIAAVTLLAPLDRVPTLLLAIIMAGGVLSAVYLILNRVLKRRRRDRPANTAFARWLHRERVRIASGQSVPYGVAIFAGSAAYFIGELHQCLFATSCSL